MARKSILNEEQKQYIRENYSSMHNQDIANAINCEKRHVKAFADREKLRKGNNRRVYLTEEEKEYILKWYNIKPTGEIARYLGYTTKKINDFAYGTAGLRRNIEKKKIDDTYFEIIDTPNKAYWLGFLYADGCITEIKRNGKLKSMMLEMTLNSEDKFHLDRLRMSLSSNCSIVDKTIKDIYTASRLTICNTKICRDLIRLGCTPRKSLTLNFPTEDQVPKHLQRHFIRGYFDGDGCVFVNNNSEKTSGSAKCSVSFVGTKPFLEKLQDILNNEIGLTKVTIYQKLNNNAYSCMWGGESNMKTIYEYLYKGQDLIYLLRKRDKFVL